MKQEIIKAEIGHTAAMNQLSVEAVVGYMYLNYRQEMLEAYTDGELIEHLGGIDQILFDHQADEAIAYVNNINGADEEN